MSLIKSISKRAVLFAAAFCSVLCLCGFDCDEEPSFPYDVDVVNTTDDTVTVFIYQTFNHYNNAFETITSKTQFIFRIAPKQVFKKQYDYYSSLTLQYGVERLLNNSDSVLIWRHGDSPVVWRAPLIDDISADEHSMYNLNSWTLSDETSIVEFEILEDDFEQINSLEK